LLHELKRFGYVKLKLEPSLTGKIIKLMQVVETSIFSLSEEDKQKFKEEFGKSSSTRNLFGYSKRPNFGKEFWKFRVLSDECDATSPNRSVSEENLNLILDIYATLHCIALAFLEKIALALEIPFDYFSSEEILSCSDCFSLSFLNVLKYHPSGDTVPCRQHCDPCLVTVVPLNTESPALEIWNCETQEWVGVECGGEPSYSSVIIFPGETLDRMTNHVIVPTLHRVNSVVLPRFSIPFQLSAKKQTTIDCNKLPSSCNPLHEDCKDTVSVSEYMYKLTYTRETPETITKRYKSSLPIINHI